MTSLGHQLPTSNTVLYRGRGLGTRVEIVVTDPCAIVSATSILQSQIERVDRLASRFRDDSEISLLNAKSGTSVSVSNELFELLRISMAVAEVTEGAVDPTVGAALLDLGYDRDFSHLASGVDGQLPRSRPVPGWRTVELHAQAKIVRAPRGSAIDLGAIAKAWAADQTAAIVADTLGCGVLVSLGGDIAIAGLAPKEGFAVAIADVCTEERGAETIALSAGGLASSGTAARRWRLGSHEVHHIIDPSTGHPVDTPWQTVSVAANTCVAANAASTAALVKGVHAPHWLTKLGLPARLMGTDGTVSFTPGWPTQDPDDPIGQLVA